MRDMFLVREEGDTLKIRCQVCEMTVYGLRNLNTHIIGKKHQAKFTSKVNTGLAWLFAIALLSDLTS